MIDAFFAVLREKRRKRFNSGVTAPPGPWISLDEHLQTINL